MGFFKDFKDDFSQAVNELMPGEDNLEDGAANEDLVVNTLENEVDVESELSKLDGLLEQVTSQTAKQQTSVQNQPVPSAPQPQPAGETKIEQPVIPENHVKNTQEERKMADNITPVVNETKPVSDEVSVITEGTIIKGDIVSNGSLDIRGNVQGDIGCNGKLVVTGTVTGNSNSSEFFADAAKIEGEVVSTGTVKIGLGSVIIGNVTSSSELSQEQSKEILMFRDLLLSIHPLLLWVTSNPVPYRSTMVQSSKVSAPSATQMLMLRAFLLPRIMNNPERKWMHK